MAVARMQRTDDSPGHSERTRAKVTASPRPLRCQSVRHFHTCLVALTHTTAAAFNAQMGSQELVVQFNRMHAELSRRLQANEAEHQRLWDIIEETKSEVGNFGGKLSNVQHVLDGTKNTARQVVESLVRDSRGALGSCSRGELCPTAKCRSQARD